MKPKFHMGMLALALVALLAVAPSAFAKGGGGGGGGAAPCATISDYTVTPGIVTFNGVAGGGFTSTYSVIGRCGEDRSLTVDETVQDIDGKLLQQWGRMLPYGIQGSYTGGYWGKFSTTYVETVNVWDGNKLVTSKSTTLTTPPDPNAAS